MKVHHVEAFIGSSVGCYGNNNNGMTAAAETSAAAIQVSASPCRKRENGIGSQCCGQSAACATTAAATAPIRTRDTSGCPNCTVEQQRGRKPRCRSGSWP